MILLLAVATGLLTGLARAWYLGHRLTVPDLRFDWLVPVAFAPQWLAFYLPVTRELMPDNLAAAILVGSQALLLVFAGFNLFRPGFWALGFGLVLNLLVIALNGGLMPISPETLAWLAPEAPPDAWQIGDRLGNGKDVILPIATTRLWWLGDCLRSRAWFPYRLVFSPGDALIAGGAFCFLWALGGGHYGRQNRREESFEGFGGTLSSHAPQRIAPDGKELSRLISAAVVSQKFCDLLLTDAATALRVGYNGSGSFQLAPEDWERVVSICATSLADFASQLTDNGRGETSLPASRK